MTNLLIIFVLFVAIMGAQSPRTYYVSPHGSDGDPGTSEHPWGTVQKAADTVGPGSTVILADGIYPEQVNVNVSGRPGNPITFAAADGATPTVDGSGSSRRAGGVFNIIEQEHIRLRGLTVINAHTRGQSGIFLQRSRHVVVENCHTRNTASSGVKLIECTDCTVNGNEIEQACLSGAEECITVKIRSDRIRVTNNHIHHSRKEGIDIKEGARNVLVAHNHIHHVERQGLYADAWNVETFNIEFVGNVVHDCGFGIAMCAETGGLLHNVRAYNNVIYNNRGPAMVVADWGRGASHPIRDVAYINNTAWNNGTERWGAGMWFENEQAHGVVVRNNILSQNTLGQIVVRKKAALAVIDHNLIHGDTQTRGEAFVLGDPMFVDSGSGEFRLQEGSPAIDAGTAERAPQTDFEGNPRPCGYTVEIGAYEHCPVTPLTDEPHQYGKREQGNDGNATTR